MIDKNKDINIIIVDKVDGHGFAYISQNEDGYIATMYQNRINNKFKKDNSIIDDLAEGKVYDHEEYTVSEEMSLLNCINSVMDFWFLPNFLELPDSIIKRYESIKEAIKNNPEETIILYQNLENEEEI